MTGVISSLAADLLKQTEKLLGTILLGNNVANTALTAIVTALAIRQFGDDDRTLLLATTAVALLIIPTILNSAYYGPAYACVQGLVRPQT